MKINTAILILFVTILTASSAHGYTREAVIKRGFLQCGVSSGSPGFSLVDATGTWKGFDVDLCRAVATATLGDATKVEFIPLTDSESFTALLSGEVDILSRHSTWTYTRDTALAVHFAGVSYYDGQGILVAEKLGAKELSDLEKVKMCSQVGSAAEKNLIDYFERSKIEYKIIPFDSLDQAIKGFSGGSCDLISMQQSQLYGLRLGLDNPETALVLPGVISREPLGPVVRQGDDTWFNIVRWSLFAMINAEELGINSNNLAEMKISNQLDIRRFFGLEGSGGKGLGLKNDWASEIIRQVGNYKELFERNLGTDSLLKIERGENKLGSHGGLQYAPPMR